MGVLEQFGGTRASFGRKVVLTTIIMLGALTGACVASYVYLNYIYDPPKPNLNIWTGDLHSDLIVGLTYKL